MNPLYCITGINRLTRQRERISLSCWNKCVVDGMRDDYLKTRAKKRTHVYPRVEVVELTLFG